MIKSIWFDGGGVLITGAAAQTRIALAAEFGFSESVEQEWRTAYKEFETGNMSFEDFVARLSKGRVTLEEIKELYCSFIQEIPGTMDILRHLQGKYLLVYANNEAREFDEWRNEKIDHFRYFDVRCSSWVSHRLKPDPAFFQYILEKIKLQAEECLFIDDKERNVLAAITLGIDSILFTDAEQLKIELRKRGIA